MRGTAGRRSTWLRQSSAWADAVRALLWKEITGEIRARQSLGLVLTFALSATVLAARASLTLAGDPDASAAVLTLILFFASVVGLARLFLGEEEQGTSGWLRLLADPVHVFVAKVIYGTALAGLICLLTVPAYLVLCGLAVSPGLAVLVCGAASFSLASAVTLCAALAARVRSGDAMVAVLALPLAIPVLWTTAGGLAGALSNVPVLTHVAFLVSYGVLMVTSGVALFPFLWEG